MRRCQGVSKMVSLFLVGMILTGTLAGCDTKTEPTKRTYSNQEIRSMANDYLRKEGRRAPCSSSEVSIEVTNIGNGIWMVSYFCPAGMFACVSVHPESGHFGLV